ncbi:MAG: hypothetical protein HZA00_10590 [Nitrospinae bacterium]|nr:hypothetical protein [Nitrospinota bacterium]
MKAVEETLKIEGEGDLINRINRVHQKLNNKDWQTDHLRFGVLTGRLSAADAMTTSVVLHSYFGYRRFMPGDLDIGRRLSLFAAVGAASSTDGKGDFSGPVYSIGLGVDIVKGVVLSGGWSVFSHRDDKSQDYKGKESFIVGISLNTELWRALFNE